MNDNKLKLTYNQQKNIIFALVQSPVNDYHITLTIIYVRN